MRIGEYELDSVNCCDALTLTRGLPAASVDLISTDPPFNIGKADWDSWATLDDYLAWLDEHLREFKRVLKPNGSLYLFAATKYQARVEMAVGAHFNVLCNIRWRKPAYSTKAEMFDKDTMRAFFPASETVIFAEQRTYSEYDLNGAAYASLKQWFRERATKHGISASHFNRALGFATTGSGMAGTIIGEKVEFLMPTAETFRQMQAVFVGVFDRTYADLRREYDCLQREYEDLRRPFYATADAPYTDVWDFATVNTYPGKHLCEKPLDMCQHIIRVSSRRGGLVLDPFCGSGNMLRAAFVEGRHYLGGDSDPLWARRAGDWIPQPFDVPLFSGELFAAEPGQ